MLDEVSKLFQERRLIAARLRDNPDFCRYEQLERALMRKLYAPETPVAAAPPQSRSREIQSRTREIKEQVSEILRHAHHPMKTREIIAALASRGVKVGGKNPVTNLSAKLSADQRFKNERHKGWRVETATKRIPLPSFLQP